MNGVRRDRLAGTLVGIIGAGTVYLSAGYHIGTPTAMGPGFFPVCIGALLVVMGGLIALLAGAGEEVGGGAEAGDTHGVARTRTAPDWRGWGCIVGGVVAFLVLSTYAGLAAAAFACVFIAAMGDRASRVWRSALLALGITVFAVLLFAYVLQIQIPVVGAL